MRSWRCGREWLEGEHQVQEQLLLQPRRYPVVLESKTTFRPCRPTSRAVDLFLEFFFSFLRKSFVLVIYLCICLCCRRRCCWWMQKSESGCYSLWREHQGSRWTALLNSTVRDHLFLSLPTALLLESGLDVNEWLSLPPYCLHLSSFHRWLELLVNEFQLKSCRVCLSDVWWFYFPGSNGPQLFTIEQWGTRDKLPRAHTWWALHCYLFRSYLTVLFSSVLQTVIKFIERVCRHLKGLQQIVHIVFYPRCYWCGGYV